MNTKFNRRVRKTMQTHGYTPTPNDLAKYMHNPGVSTKDKQTVLSGVSSLDLNDVYERYMELLSFEDMSIDTALMDVSITLTFLIGKESHTDAYVNAFSKAYYADNKRLYKGAIDVYLLAQKVIALVTKQTSGCILPKDGTSWIDEAITYTTGTPENRYMLSELYTRVVKHTGLSSVASLSPRGK